MQTNFVISPTEVAKQNLVYYSDYFSFVGEDEIGKLAFAIDNNRGRDGDSFQADHFVILYDEHKGWIEVQGNGLYENKSKSLEEIPDSNFFSFNGDVDNGIIILSEPNQLKITIQPLQVQLDKNKGLSRYQMRSGPATLQWQGRTIKGRIIYEYIYFPSFNRLSRKYFSVFKDFQGIYARVEEDGDFYLHLQKSDQIAPLVGYKKGFLRFEGQTFKLDAIDIEADARTQGMGFYRWPISWSGNAGSGDAEINLRLNLKQRNSLFNWVIGAFAMGIVEGEIMINGKKQKIYGLGELIL